MASGLSKTMGLANESHGSRSLVLVVVFFSDHARLAVSILHKPVSESRLFAKLQKSITADFYRLVL